VAWQRQLIQQRREVFDVEKAYLVIVFMLYFIFTLFLKP
jgi:hypothetical protein